MLSNPALKSRADLLIAAVDKRKHLFADKDTNCFRLFNGLADGIDGLTIDLYASHVLLQIFRKEQWDRRHELAESFKGIINEMPFGIKGILLKNRLEHSKEESRQDLRRSMLLYGQYPDDPCIVYQNGVAVRVDLVNGQSTGIFLDMREVRERLVPVYASLDEGSLLNLFSYTSVFSIHARKNGMLKAVNVDLSKAVLRRARNNYILNDLNVDDRDFVYGDSFDWLKRFKKKGQCFDIVICDPPTFSRNRKRAFSVKQDYMTMMEAAQAVSNGLVLSCINSFSVSRDEYISFHPDNWKLIWLDHESTDFPACDNYYLKAGLWSCR